MSLKPRRAATHCLETKCTPKSQDCLPLCCHSSMALNKTELAPLKQRFILDAQLSECLRSRNVRWYNSPWQIADGRSVDSEVTRSQKSPEKRPSDVALGCIAKCLYVYYRVKLVIYMVLLMAYSLWHVAYGRWRIAEGLLLTLTILCFNMCIYAQELPGNQRAATGHVQQPRTVLHGEVRSAVDGRPIEGASIRIGKQQRSTDKEGKFAITVQEQEGSLEVRHLGYQAQKVGYGPASTPITIRLEPLENTIEEVQVVSTGYQKIPKERATGSFEFIDSALFNRKVSTDFLSRLEDVVPGLSTNKYRPDARGDYMNTNIRGLSTLRGDSWPLIVIDGVPYESKLNNVGYGTFNNINPNDIENVTILKDAAASSIWGARAGNGVIVITTKKAKFNEKTVVNIHSNISIKDKPDLYYLPQLRTTDYIDVTKSLFDAGRFDWYLDDWASNPEPIVLLMDEARKNKITKEQLNTQLDALRNIDIRDDFLKYVYRKGVNQQYSVRLNAGGDRVNTSVGVGYDKNREELVTSAYNRLNMQSNTQIKATKGLLLNLGITYTESRKIQSFQSAAYNGLAKGVSNWPYMKLADEAGNPLSVDISGFSRSFRDTVAHGRLQGYGYIPLEDIHHTQQRQYNHDLLANISASYSFPSGLRITGLYAYQRNQNPAENWYGRASYMQRMRLNDFASWNDDLVTWNLPLGDHYGERTWSTTVHQARLTSEYQYQWRDHDLTLFGGLDIRSLNRGLRVVQYDGFDPETGSFKSLAHGSIVPILNGLFGTGALPDHNSYEDFFNRYVSYFGNASYTYRHRYILSASARKDASNLFGVKTNDKGQPFWSVGGAWLLSKDDFIDEGLFPLLKLRATYGYNGNVSTETSAYPIIYLNSRPNTITGSNYAQMNTPPNPKLRWERVGNLNLGLDFALKGNFLGGSIEYYEKKAKDLIAAGQIDPTTGFASMRTNFANLHTKGWDISLNGKPLSTKDWEWNSNLVFAYSRTMVTKAFLATDIAWLLAGAQTVPVEGENLHSLRTYKWAGLDPEDGTPRGYLDGEVSKNYSAITGAKLQTLDNHGSQVPVYFGSWRNGVRYKSLEVSWNISYQLGHRFIRTSFINAEFLNQKVGHTDYQDRWQKPGDEVRTDVPAFTYPNNATGSDLYRASSALVEDAGQIKLRDIQMSVQLPALTRYGLKNMRIYAYLQNLGTIWRANKRGIDPEYGTWYPDPMMTSVGINFNL